jgi:hypothetical protein
MGAVTWLSPARDEASSVAACALATALTLGGCHGVSEPTWKLLPGYIDVAAGPAAVIEVPATARANAPFTVTVHTYGSPSCTRAYGATITIQGLVANVVPIDWQAPTGTECSDERKDFPRPVELTFTGAGDALIHVEGRDASGATVSVETPIHVEP